MAGIFIIIVTGFTMIDDAFPSSGFSGFSSSKVGTLNPTNHMNNVTHPEEIILKKTKTYTTYNSELDLVVSGYKIFGVLINLILIIVSATI